MTSSRAFSPARAGEAQPAARPSLSRDPAEGERSTGTRPDLAMSDRERMIRAGVLVPAEEVDARRFAERRCLEIDKAGRDEARRSLGRRGPGMDPSAANRLALGTHERTR